jgi:uncharacterized protein (TIGR02466 family)
MNTQDLFPIVIGKDTIRSTYSLDNIDWRRSQDNNGWISKDNRLLEQQQFADLKLQIILKHKQYMDRIGVVAPVEWRIQNSWANRHDPGDWAQQHHHSNSAFSGVYYSQVPEGDSGSIQFHKQHATVSTNSWEFDFAIGPANAYSWGFQPVPGDCVLFPSHVAHSVTPNNTQGQRISIAWNILPYGEWGHGLHSVYR